MATDPTSLQRGAYKRLWALRPYRLFWLANVFSNLGTSAFVMAMTWLTVSRYGAHGIALLALGYAVPQFLLQLLGGATTDSIAHRRLFLGTETAFLLGALLLWLASRNGEVPLLLLVGVNAFNGVVSAFDTPARTTLITEMVPSDELVNAQQFYSVAANLTNVFGPALGGVLLSLGRSDQSHEENAFLFNVLSFLPLICCIPLLPAGRRPRRDKAVATGRSAAMLRSIVDGLAYVSRQRQVRVLMALLAMVMLLGMPFQTLLPIFVHDHPTLHGGHQLYAALLSAVGLGGLIGSLVGMSVSAGQRRSLGLTLGLAALGLALAIVLLVASRVVHWTSLAAFFAGACSVLSVNLNTALVMGLTPLDIQGRVSAIASMGKGLQSFAAAAASEAIHWLTGLMPAGDAYQWVQSLLAVALMVAVLWIWTPLSRVERSVPDGDGCSC